MSFDTNYFASRPNRSVEATIDVAAHTAYDGCACDISRLCDQNCHCDPDCPEAIRSSFPLSKPERNPDSKHALYEWALVGCDDERADPPGDAVIDWLMRTIICVVRDNNPLKGHFYPVTERLGNDTGPYNNDEVPAVDPQFSFRDVFKWSPDVALTRVAPGYLIPNVTESFLKRGDGGSCERAALQYLVPLTGTCTVGKCSDLNLTSRDNGTCGTTSFQIRAEVGYNPREAEEGWDLQITTYENTTVHENGSYTLSVQWETNTEATTVLTKRGYEFFEELETLNGSFVIRGANGAGDCDFDSDDTRIPVRFGTNMDIVCTLNESDWNESGDLVMPEDPFQLTYSAVRPIPNQVGTEDIATVTVPGATVQGAVNARLDGFLQEIVFFYRIAGSVGHPQKVIQEIGRRMRSVYRGYEVPKAWISRDDKLLRTVVQFFEIPNNVNMEIVSSVDTKAQAWLPL